MKQNRILWVDTVKAFGMFFIVLGHFFPPYISAWIYTFNVPLFFFMSGFLAKKEGNWKVFWRKNFNGLIVPFLLLSTLINIPYIVSNVSDGQRLLSLLAGLLLGFHSIDGMNGCMNMWFVYCLLFVKILFQITSKSRCIDGVLMVLCILGMILYHYFGCHLKWAVSNVLYAYPYFVLGYWFKVKNVEKIVTKKMHDWRWNCSVSIASVATALIASYNGIAYTYEGGVGKSLIIMVLCSLINILAMVRFSYAFQNFREQDIRIISKGSILILAFHLIIVYRISRLVEHFLKDYPVIECFAFIFFSLGICVVFIPFIHFVHKHLPILMGKR